MSRFQLNLATLCLAFVVITLGAFVRLSDAGLGCPDWPGCYGHLDVPTAQADVARANERFAHRPVEAPKAWKEMIHRYAAGTLGLLILAMALAALRRSDNPHQQRALPWVLVALVIFQALLGMWTVTLLLKPLIVTGHLLGGMATFALLGWCLYRQGNLFSGWRARSVGTLRVAAGVALALLVGQIFLGAWTSTNYAALACPDFPTCQTYWWPPTDYPAAFTLWHGLGINYEYGILDSIPRATIHWTHRLGAVLIVAVLVALAGLLFRQGVFERRWRGMGLTLLAALALQVGLGISTVVFHLPLPVAVAHNGGAALLLLTLVAINHAAWRARDHV
ncbi:COX15/CtaA family protein [Salinisphaera sp. T31B1]|uniref:COX15/CtaA family protein n=1 Tax=Salinisphaera sp. T31B1 TaxID=727963 RepID=UPI00333FB7E0